MGRQLNAALSTDELLASAEGALANGLLPAAASMCDGVLAENPDNVRALVIRGLCLALGGNRRSALRDLEKAVRLQPLDPVAVLRFSQVLADEGNFQDALSRIGAVLGRVAIQPSLLRDFGELLIRLGRPADAIPLLDAALLHNPTDAAAFNMRGFASQQIGDHRAAVGNFSRALLLQSSFHHAANNRGNSLQSLGRPEESIRDYDMAISFDAAYANAWANRAKALVRIGQEQAALDSVRKARSLEPRTVNFRAIEAEVLQVMGRHQEAAALLEEAAKFDEGSADIWNNLGLAQQKLGDFDKAASSFDRAVALRNPFPQALWNRGLLRLSEGDMQRGWPDFEWRWQCPELGRKPSLAGVPEWTGQLLQGKSIAVITEQGMGDILQFSRYLKLLLLHATRVVLIVPARMHRVLRTLDARLELVDPQQPVPAADLQVLLMDLPARFGSTLDSLPRDIPYLSPEATLIESWKKIIGSHGVKVGIVWQGNPAFAADRERSINLAALAPLAAVEGVRLISLQYRDGLDQLASLPQGMKVEVLPGFNEGPDAFVDTAAVMKCLDLVVTVDSAPAHLAGALGVPAYVMLNHVPEWRWLREREDTPWYPGLRLFRQTASSGWEAVVLNVQKALRALAEKGEA